MTSDPVSTTVVSPPALGRLDRIDARTVWKHEAQDFTPWLLEHAELLADALGVDIELSEREVAVGAFSVDLVGRVSGTELTVIVENQLAATDHSHLGQLLTYAAGLEAAYIVWLTPEFRDEHRRALDWLNEVTREGISFFGVELELLRIIDATGTPSQPAPHFKLVAQPNDWQKQARTIGATGGGSADVPSERALAYQSFFTDVLQRIKSRIPGATRAQRVGTYYWLNLPSGRAGIYYSLNFTRDGRFKVELYIDAFDAAGNKAFFSWLEQDRASIEAAVGEPLRWERLDNRRASRIALYQDGRITDSAGRLEALKEFAVNGLIRFREAFGPRLLHAPSFSEGTISVE